MPNILVIMTDQQRADALGCAGNPVVKTPNIDSIAATGTRFSNTYSQAPLCAPNRASLYTGRYTAAHGVMCNGVEFVVSEENKSVAQVFKDNGYKTACFGKMHLHGPTGFDLGFGDSPEDNYQLHDYEREIGPKSSPDNPMGNAIRSSLEDHAIGKMEVEPENSFENIITDRAIEFIRNRGEDGPFLVWLSFFGPHPPYAAPEPYHSMYDPDDIPDAPKPPEGVQDDARNFRGYLADYAPGGKLDAEDWPRLAAQYYGMCTHIDDNVGRVLRALEEEGLSDETIVVYTSDHGDSLGDHGFHSKGLYMYEGIAKAPFIISVPGVTGGEVSEALVQSVDLMPTLLELTGVDRPDSVQGKSLVPIIRGEQEHVHDVVLAEVGFIPSERVVMIRTGNHKYVYYTDGSEELFDLKNDPNEFTNLAALAENKDLVSEMRLKMLDMKIRTEDPLPRNMLPTMGDVTPLSSTGRKPLIEPE
ncbi:sulfatase [Candidatus Hydrogenedentota bacterium]